MNTIGLIMILGVIITGIIMNSMITIKIQKVMDMAMEQNVVVGKENIMERENIVEL
jgi:hypothetical protein